MEKNTKGTRRIVQVLNEIKEAIEKHTKTHRPQDEHQQEKRNVPMEVRSEVRFDDQTVGNESSDKDKDRRIQNSIKRAAWSAFVAAFVYAGISGYQTYLNRQALIATQKSVGDFEAAQAAEISVDFAPTVKQGKPGQGLIIDGTIDVSNTGPTAAVNFTAMGWQWGRNLAPPKPGIPGIVGVSGNVTPFNVSGILLGSGKTQKYPIGIQIGQSEEIRRNEWQSGIWIDFQYNDVFGRAWSGRDCFMVNPSNILEFIRCPNDVQQ
jgi:hypothetical protein